MFQITSGLSRSRLLRSSAALLMAKSKRAQHVEAFMRLAQIRMRFLDDRAGLGEPRRRLAGDGGDLGIDRRDAEIGRIGDALRVLPERAADRNDVGSERQRQRIGRMLAAHGVEQQREVLDIARHRALDAEIAVDLGDRAYARRGRCSAACRRRRRSSRDCAASRPCRSRARARPCRSRAPPRRRRRSRRPSATYPMGLRVAPNTSLKVLAPAPNSGVFDLA